MADDKTGLKAAAIFFIVLLVVANYINVMGNRLNKTDAVITSDDGDQAVVKNVTVIPDDTNQTIRIGDIVFGINTSYIMQDDKVYVKTDKFDEVIESFIQKGYVVENYEDIHE